MKDRLERQSRRTLSYRHIHSAVITLPGVCSPVEAGEVARVARRRGGDLPKGLRFAQNDSRKSEILRQSLRMTVRFTPSVLLSGRPILRGRRRSAKPRVVVLTLRSRRLYSPVLLYVCSFCPRPERSLF